MMRIHGLLLTVFFEQVRSVQFTGPGGGSLVDSSGAFSVSASVLSVWFNEGSVSVLSFGLLDP